MTKVVWKDWPAGSHEVEDVFEHLTISEGLLGVRWEF